MLARQAPGILVVESQESRLSSRTAPPHYWYENDEARQRQCRALLGRAVRHYVERSRLTAPQTALRRPIKKLTIKITKNATKQNFAPAAAVPATTPNPSTAAMMATTKNTQA